MSQRKIKRYLTWLTVTAVRRALKRPAKPANNYQLAIISNGLMSAQGLRLKAAGIDHFFEAII